MSRMHGGRSRGAALCAIRYAAPILLACACGVARTQEQAQSTETATGPLQEVTVTATRHEESLSKVPISVTALTQENLDNLGIKDFSAIARFTPGVSFDNSGTNNISIRGISSTGGAGTTGIYIDETPIQMRALAFNPDDALPKSFDIERVEVLRGPQGTLFGAGAEGGVVRYITAQPSLTKTSMYGRAEAAYTDYGSPSYELGYAIGGPLIEGTLGARVSLWYRRDGGWVDRIDPTTLATLQHDANYVNTALVRVALLWAPSESWSLTPAFYYQNQQRNDISNFWPLYSNPSSGSFLDADPSQRQVPDKFYLASLKIQGEIGAMELISNTAYYWRQEQTGYEGTLYNLGFYQAQPSAANQANGATPVFALPNSPCVAAGTCTPFLPGIFPMLAANGVLLPAGATSYRSPNTIDNGQENITEEIRLQSSNPGARLKWTTGIFLTENRQSYLEQIHDPMLSVLTQAATGVADFTQIFLVGYDPTYPEDSYFLQTSAKDTQAAIYGEATYAFTDWFRATLGARYSRDKYSFDTFTGGPQLFAPSRTGSGDISESPFTPKVGVEFQPDSHNLYYLTYAKGFRPGGANNPIPYAACASDFINFGITGNPGTFSSDSVNSYEIGAKNNFGNRFRLATSIYYIDWSNIQQTVIPPICQISFIANLGQATAKGIDIQGDIAVTDRFTIDFAAGYTDARYTKDSRLSPTETTPIVASGDAITGQSSETGGGQPTAPVTVALGLNYQFLAFGRQSFVRLDGEYEARAKWVTPGTDPNTLQYDPANFVLPGRTFMSLRAGMEFGSWSVSAFADNLTNSQALLDYNHSICSQPPDCGTSSGSRLQRNYSYQPLTLGITAIFRQ